MPVSLCYTKPSKLLSILLGDERASVQTVQTVQTVQR
jgi:hypothetical protein